MDHRNTTGTAINLWLPTSRLDVESVSANSFGKYDVLIAYNEQSEGNKHAILVGEPNRPTQSVLEHVDTDKDGKTDIRTLRFQTESGFIRYFDFDANGVLDALYSYTSPPEGESTHEARILVEQCWVAIEGDYAVFHDPALQVTSKEEPPVTYHFEDGAWHTVEASASDTR